MLPQEAHTRQERTNIAAFSRRAFLSRLTAAGALFAFPPRVFAQADWHALLPVYTEAALNNIVEVNSRRAMLSSRLYPGTYVRDALFWGPLALTDPVLGGECYRWFAESQLESGQIRSAVSLRPEDDEALEPKDDEGTLLFILASDWLRMNGYTISKDAAVSTFPAPATLDAEQIERAYAWVETHVVDHQYISPAGPFRYWADTVMPDRAETISHNQGLLCLARRAMLNLGLGGVTEADVQAAQAAWHATYDIAGHYLPFGQYSNFARAQDNSAVFPEWLSRYLYHEPILDDAMVANHAARILTNATVFDEAGQLAGVKIISAEDGDFLPRQWFHEPGLNAPGDYQNGGYWPLYTHVMLALAYSVTRDPIYTAIAEALVRAEIGRDRRTKEMIRLSPGQIGTFLDVRADYTWNALIPVALRWAGIIS